MAQQSGVVYVDCRDDSLVIPGRKVLISMSPGISGEGECVLLYTVACSYIPQLH